MNLKRAEDNIKKEKENNGETIKQWNEDVEKKT